MLAAGDPPSMAMTEGYQRASMVTALLSVAAAVMAATVLRRAERPMPDGPDAQPAATALETSDV